MDFNIADIPGEEDVRRSAEAHLVGKAQKDPAFRQQLLQNPKKVIASELGVQLPTDFEVKVFEESSKSLYLVLPVPAEKDELSDQLLDAVAGGCMKNKPPVKETADGGSSVPGTGSKGSPYVTTDPNTGEMDAD